MVTSMKAVLARPVEDRDHVQGPAGAPVTLVEYGDFECPYCAAAHVVVKQVQEILKGQLRFVFRHFPLTQMHPHAEQAAEASEAAAAQGQFWEMHDLLYENQPRLDTSHLLMFARGLGLDIKMFARQVHESVYRERVRRDFLGGIRSGVNGTPAFFINGVRYDGSWELMPLIEALNSASILRSEV